MKTLSVHGSLRASTLALLIAVPLVTFEVWMISQQPYWRFPIRAAEVWTGAVALMILPLLFWMNQLRRWAFMITAIFLTSWILATAWIAIRMRFPNLGFFDVGLIVLFSSLLSWIHIEMGRSFLDPQVDWFESTPKPIPGLSCRLQNGEETNDFKVGRLDLRGTFVIQPKFPLKSAEMIQASTQVSVQFRFRDATIELQGIVRKVTRQANGVGIQFERLAPDLQKEMGDFMEKLRGEGYV